MREHLYHYRATVLSVYDGDTCTLDIDLGLHSWVRDEKVRLARINAPELRGAEREAGLAARDYLRTRIDGRQVWIQTIKDRKGKYGRYIAEIWLEDEPEVFINLSDELVNTGHAAYHAY